MTATIAPARTATEIILDAWQVYRRAQQVPFIPEISKAQYRLMHLVEAFTRTDDRHPPARPDTDSIADAIDVLVAAIEWHCGPEAAAYVSGEEGGD